MPAPGLQFGNKLLATPSVSSNEQKPTFRLFHSSIRSIFLNKSGWTWSKATMACVNDRYSNRSRGTPVTGDGFPGVLEV